MDKEKGQIKQFFIDCYNSETPVWLITKNDDWIGGYLNELPSDEYIEVLDRKRKLPVRIMYSNIHLKSEFQGSYAELPLPEYLKLRRNNEALS